MSLRDEVQRMLQTLTPAELKILRRRFPDLEVETEPTPPAEVSTTSGNPSGDPSDP